MPNYDPTDVRRIPIDEERFITVFGGDYPWITEWEWDLEEETGLAFRLSGGDRVYIFHEMLKRHRNTPYFVALGPEILDKLFAHQPEFQTMIHAWGACQTAASEHGITIPHPLDILAYSLSATLYLYDRWMTEEVEHTFQETPDEELPGNIFSRLREGPHEYVTLDEWMLDAFTGNWTESDETASGMEPETFYDLAMEAIGLTFDALLCECNTGVNSESVWDYFEANGTPFNDLLRPVHDLIGTYPITSHW